MRVRPQFFVCSNFFLGARLLSPFPTAPSFFTLSVESLSFSVFVSVHIFCEIPGLCVFVVMHAYDIVVLSECARLIDMCLWRFRSSKCAVCTDLVLCRVFLFCCFVRGDFNSL